MAPSAIEVLFPSALSLFPPPVLERCSAESIIDQSIADAPAHFYLPCGRANSGFTFPRLSFFLNFFDLDVPVDFCRSFSSESFFSSIEAALSTLFCRLIHPFPRMWSG